MTIFRPTSTPDLEFLGPKIIILGSKARLVLGYFSHPRPLANLESGQKLSFLAY